MHVAMIFKIVCFFVSVAVQASDCWRDTPFPSSPSSPHFVRPIDTFEVVRDGCGVVTAPLTAVAFEFVGGLPATVPSVATEAAVVPHVRVRSGLDRQRQYGRCGRHRRLGRQRVPSREPRQR